MEPRGTTDDDAGWTDLAHRAPGIGVSHEAARRRQAEGAGADRSWRVGADGEVAVGELLAQLTTPSRWERLRGKPPAWHVLHSVPLTNHHGEARGDVDHLLIGPPGVVAINTKHHRGGRLELDADQLILNGRPADYVRRSRLEGLRVGELLRPALTAADLAPVAARVQVHCLIVVVGGRLLVKRWPSGVAVVMTRQLLHTLSSMTPVLDSAAVQSVFEIARRSTTWTPQRRPTSPA